MKPKTYKPHKQPVHDQPESVENEDADPVGKIPGAEELEEAAKRDKRPLKAESARSPDPASTASSARSADVVQQEAEITEAAMPTPNGVTHPNF